MSRILNRQRQLAEQGRLRSGYTVQGERGPRPVASKTWVVTSHSREHVEHAASLWGGKAEAWEPLGNGASQWRVITEAATIPAILPPGDPLTSAYESWSKGGCQRRCDGVTESFSGSPCICLAQHGEQWYELSAREVCVSKSRLKVLLPDMPGLGSWRMETGSFYATDEIAGMVDTIRGAVGESVLVPVQLRIEPRTRVAGGQTKQFVVPVVELRGVTAGALLSGQAVETGALKAADMGSSTPAALQASKPAEDAYTPFLDRLDKATNVAECQQIWTDITAAHLRGDGARENPDADPARATEFLEAYKAKGSALPKVQDAPPQPAANPDGTYDAEIVPEGDGNAEWQQILTVAGERKMSTPDLEDDVARFLGGVPSNEASAAELQSYLEDLRGRPANEQVPA